MSERLLTGLRHIEAIHKPLLDLEARVDQIEGWGRHLASVLEGGGRLLAAGNGGSAAEAQHLTSELVGRYRDERRAFSAIALHAESSSVTAIENDYGPTEMFARQVRAHGREGDVLVALSTSGRSPNVLAAADAARQIGIKVFALTGRGPNPLSERSDDAFCVDADTTATVQEVHLMIIHLLCGFVDVAVGASEPA